MSTASRSTAAAEEAAEAAELGVPGVLLFGIPADKDAEGSGAWDDEGIVQLAHARDQGRRPDLLVIADVCLCEYTDHGHCGLLRDDGEVDNDATLELLARTAVAQAQGRRRRRRAERHDGRPRRRDPRRARRRRPRPTPPILAYAAKYAPRFYGPFREAAGSHAVVRRPARLPDGPAPTAARRCARRCSTWTRAPTSSWSSPRCLSRRHPPRQGRVALPVAAYNVSGEYAMSRRPPRPG